MVHIDMTAPDRELNPGVHLWTVKKCEQTVSRGGDQMLKLELRRDDGAKMFDNIMLQGGGWPIGKRKLAVFVGPDFKGDLDPLTIQGRRVWAETVVEAYNGRDNLKVNIEGLKHAGYQDVNDTPPGQEPAPPEVDDSDVPF